MLSLEPTRGMGAAHSGHHKHPHTQLEWKYGRKELRTRAPSFTPLPVNRAKPSPCSQFSPRGCCKQNQAERDQERDGDTGALTPPLPTLNSLRGCGVQQAEPRCPGQVLCTLLPLPSQGKHKHPTQRKHFSSATQFPFLHRAGLFSAAFPTTLSQSPAEISGLGLGHSQPSQPKTGRGNALGAGGGLQLTPWEILEGWSLA